MNVSNNSYMNGYSIIEPAKIELPKEALTPLQIQDMKYAEIIKEDALKKVVLLKTVEFISDYSSKKQPIKMSSQILLINMLKIAENSLNSSNAIPLEKIMSLTSTLNMLSTQMQLVKANKPNDIESVIKEFEQIVIEDFAEKITVLENTGLGGTLVKHCITMTDKLGNLYLHAYKTETSVEDVMPSTKGYPTEATSEVDYFARLAKYAGERFFLKSSFLSDYLSNIELNTPGDTIAQVGDHRAVIYRDVIKDLPRTRRIIWNGKIEIDMATDTMPECIKGLDRGDNRDEVSKRLVEYFTTISGRSLQHTLEVLKIATQASAAKLEATMATRFQYQGYRSSKSQNEAEKTFENESQEGIGTYLALKAKLESLTKENEILNAKDPSEMTDKEREEIDLKKEEMALKLEAAQSLVQKSQDMLENIRQFYLDERLIKPMDPLRIIEVDTTEINRTKINIQSVYKIQNVYEQKMTGLFCKASMYFEVNSDDLEKRSAPERTTQVIESYSKFYQNQEEAEKAQPHIQKSRWFRS